MAALAVKEDVLLHAAVWQRPVRRPGRKVLQFVECFLRSVLHGMSSAPSLACRLLVPSCSLCTGNARIAALALDTDIITCPTSLNVCCCPRIVPQ